MASPHRPAAASRLGTGEVRAVNGGSLLVIFCLLVGWWCMRSSGSRSGRASTGRMVSVTGHGQDRATIARHEAGHAAAARALGGRVRSAHITNNSGLVQATLPTSSSQAAVTFWLAGQIAAGTTHGAHADDQLVRRELRGLPSAERRQVLRAATSDANRIVRSHAGRINRDTATLNQKGRL